MLLKPRSSNTRSSANLISWIVQFIVILQCIATSYQISYPSNPHSSDELSDDVASNNITRLKNEFSPESDFNDSESSPSSHRSSRKRWRGPSRRRSNRRSPPKRKYKRMPGKRKRSNGMFSPWSRWPPCDINCKQTRDRFCLNQRKCGAVKQIEERNCPPHICQQLSSLYATASPQRTYGLSPIAPAQSYGSGPITPTQSYGPIPSNLPLQQWGQSSDDAPEYRIRRQRRRKTKRRPIIVELDDADYRDAFDEYDDDDEEVDFPRRARNNDERLVLKVVKQGRQRGRFRSRSDEREPIFLPSNITSSPNILAKGQQKNKKSTYSSYEDEEDYDNEQDETNFELKRRIQEKAVFEMPRKPEANYTKWSKWTKCSPKCTTRRSKKCTPRARGICGKEIIREVAYCYTEGSFCEEWINSQLHQINSQQVEAKPTTTKPTRPPRSQIADRRTESPSVNSVDQDFEGYLSNGLAMTSNRNRWQPEVDVKPQNFTCGFPSIRNKGKSFQLKILGGKISRRGQWPWQVVILNRFKEAFCGGTLIAPNWIITAAHCVRKKLYVKLGEHNLQKDDGSEIELKIEMSIKHPKYDKKTVDNDIALLKLPITIERSHYIGFACLPERFQQLPVGHTCTIIGWGKRRHNDDAGTNVLHEAQVPVISNDECKAVYYDYTITKNMFCAGHKRGRIDTCAGDSGGPILCRDAQKSNKWTIYGITSFGDGCGKKNKFGIYAKLTNYIDWVWSVINCKGYCKY